MARGRTRQIATVGVAENGSAAVLVTVGPDGALIDRRRIELIDPGLPTHPYHHEGSWAVGRYLNTPGARKLSLADAVALVERVQRAARVKALAAPTSDVPVPIAGIALRVCPKLPPTIEARIADNRAQTMADTVMYRQALSSAAEARGWSVVSACLPTPRRRSAKRTSTPFCLRWVYRSGRPGALSKSLRLPQRLRPYHPPCHAGERQERDKLLEHQRTAAWRRF